MARVISFHETAKEGTNRHTQVECGWRIVTDDSGTRLLTLETYGSTDRKIAGKVSQSLQLDRSAAVALKRILEDVFGI